MSRRINNFADAQRAINELLDFKSAILTQSIDMKGNRVRNAAPGVRIGDYVTWEQLTQPTSTQATDDHIRTIPFSTAGVVTTDDPIPPYEFGVNMESTPYQVWMQCITYPTTGNLSINIKYKLNKDTDVINLLVDPLTIEVGAEEGVRTSAFVTPIPSFARGGIIYPVILSGGDAATVSIGVVVKRNM